ncbi:MAG: peptide deformylase [Verrucomicrobia subdivision 3 bacterium]|nr:peptide deformylase [Limisphaerales bacterium]
MILPVVKYGHPILRKKGAAIEKMTSEIKKLIDDMFETMYDAAGIGLAAQQVGHAVQLTVIDVRAASKERPSRLEVDGKAVDVAEYMPLALINPKITPFGDPTKGPEGCLSFPEIYADITRPESVEVEALNAKGERIHFRAGGLLARAVQHEVDHLNGILFIDRMAGEAKAEIKAEIETLQAETKALLKKRQ